MLAFETTVQARILVQIRSGLEVIGFDLTRLTNAFSAVERQQ